MPRQLSTLTTTEIAIIDWLYGQSELEDTNDYLALHWNALVSEHKITAVDTAPREMRRLFVRFVTAYPGNPSTLLQPDVATRACTGVRWLLSTITTECLLGQHGLLRVEDLAPGMPGALLYQTMSRTLRDVLRETLLGECCADKIRISPGPLGPDGVTISKEAIWALVEDLLYRGVSGVTEWLSDFHVRTVYRLCFGLVSRGYDVTPTDPNAQVITGRFEYLRALAD